MSWFLRIFQTSNIRHKESPEIPVIEFDSSLVTKTVKEDLKKNMMLIDELSAKNFKQIYDIALRSISKGRDLHMLCEALKSTEGLNSSRASQIALSLHNKATSLINRERAISLGIKQQVWMYSGAPCMNNPSFPTDTELQMDESHRNANGKRYDIKKGLFLNGKWTWPGVEEGCKCFSKSILPTEND